MNPVLLAALILLVDTLIVYALGGVHLVLRKLVASGRISRFHGGVILNLLSILFALSLMFAINGYLLYHYGS